MRIIFFAILVFVSCASAWPSRFWRFGPSWDWDTDTYASALAGSNSGLYSGVYTGVRPYPPFLIPSLWPFHRDHWPFHRDHWTFHRDVPWHKGKNVCGDKQSYNISNEMKEFLGEDFSDYDYSHESERCRGGNERTVCVKRECTNDGCKMEKTTYFCCKGYVRSMSGPGCVENDQSPDGPVPEQASPSQVK